MENWFEGLKVVELAGVLAGPMAGMFFAERGAEVIKIENARSNGDVTRSWKLESEDDNSNVSAYFSSINYHKKYLFLDLSKSDHINEVYRLIKDADILLSNFKDGDDYKFGLDYSRVKSINPKIIYAHLAGFDSFPERVAYDVALQAESGFMYMNGTPESGPLKMPVALMDILAAHQLKEAVLTALWLREKDGKGRKIHCSLEASALSALANQATNFLMAGHIPQPMGSLHPNIAPYGETFNCRDGRKVVLAIGTDKQFIKLCALLGDAELAILPQFLHNHDRVEHRRALFAALEPLFALQKRDELIDRCTDESIPVAAIRAMDEVMQLPKAQNMILEEEIDGVQTKRLSSIAFRIE